MKIAVIGPGAIGGLVTGYLKSKNEDISLIGRKEAVGAVKKNGLLISGVRGNFKIDISIQEKLDFAPDLTILATKTQDLVKALKESASFLKDSLVLTTQNGVRADALAADFFPREKIISSIVMFGSTNIRPGEIVHNFEGSWVIGMAFGENEQYLDQVSPVLGKAFTLVRSKEILGMKYLKIFVNANNCIPAILGKSMQEAFSDLDICKISIAIWKEGLRIIEGSSIKLVSLPDFPLDRLTKLTGIPLAEGTKIFSGIMAGLSKEPLYGSVLQSIKRGRPSEIDYLNGEFVVLAKKNDLHAPLNEKLVEMVHVVEKSGRFFSKEELLNNTKDMIW